MEAYIWLWASAHPTRRIEEADLWVGMAMQTSDWIGIGTLLVGLCAAIFAATGPVRADLVHLLTRVRNRGAQPATPRRVNRPGIAVLIAALLLTLGDGAVLIIGHISRPNGAPQCPSVSPPKPASATLDRRLFPETDTRYTDATPELQAIWRPYGITVIQPPRSRPCSDRTHGDKHDSGQSM